MLGSDGRGAGSVDAGAEGDGDWPPPQAARNMAKITGTRRRVERTFDLNMEASLWVE
jgi:hypothetical protein